jgi:hypothetical protein
VPAGQAAVTTAVLDEPDEGLQAFVQGLLLGSYRFSLKSSGPSAGSPAQVSLLVAGGDGVRHRPAAPLAVRS